MKVEKLNLSVRIITILENNGYVDVEELAADPKSVVASIRGLSQKDVEAIDNALAELGIPFAEEETYEDEDIFAL